MKDRMITLCPGCGRHCSMENVRCNKGRQYFAGLAAEENRDDEKPKKHKWEQYVAQDSPLRVLLQTGHEVKKALRDGVPEEKLVNSITGEERIALEKLLWKIDFNVQISR